MKKRKHANISVHVWDGDICIDYGCTEQQCTLAMHEIEPAPKHMECSYNKNGNCCNKGARLEALIHLQEIINQQIEEYEEE